MNGNPDAPPTFDELFGLLADELNSAYTKAVFFHCLFEEQNLPTLDAIAPGFFSRVQDVLFDDLVLTLARLTDLPSTAGTPNLTLSRLLEMLDNERFPDVHQSLEASLRCLRTRSANLRKHRNKRIAHNDLQTFQDRAIRPQTPAELFAKTALPGIRPSDIHETLEMAAQVMSRISEY